jgi:hypothetical protein
MSQHENAFDQFLSTIQEDLCYLFRNTLNTLGYIFRRNFVHFSVVFKGFVFAKYASCPKRVAEQIADSEMIFKVTSEDFVENALYHSACITRYLLRNIKTEIEEPLMSEHENAFDQFVSDETLCIFLSCLKALCLQNMQAVQSISEALDRVTIVKLSSFDDGF